MHLRCCAFCPLSPPTPLSPSGRERGAKQPHLVLSRRLAFYRRGACPCAKHAAADERSTEVAGGAVAEVKQPNVAVRSPFPPRWGWKGGWGDRGGLKSGLIQIPSTRKTALRRAALCGYRRKQRKATVAPLGAGGVSKQVAVTLGKVWRRLKTAGHGHFHH